MLMKDLLDEAFGALTHPPPRMASGLASLDEMLGGGFASGYSLIAARPGQGKSSLLTQILLNCAKFRPVIFSLEMSQVQIIHRLIAQRTGINLERILRNRTTENEARTIRECREGFKDLPLWIDPGVSVRPSYIHSTLADLRESGFKFGCVAIDYIGLMQGDRLTDNRNNELGEISRSLVETAKTFGVPLLVASQLNRGSERENRRPRLSDLRDSGNLEQDAELVLFLHRPGYYRSLEDTSYRDDGKCELVIAKNRYGPTGITEVTFDADTTSFRDESTRFGDF